MAGRLPVAALFVVSIDSCHLHHAAGHLCDEQTRDDRVNQAGRC